MKLTRQKSNVIKITNSSRLKFKAKKMKIKAEAEMKSFLITADSVLFILFSVFLVAIILPIILVSYILAIPFYPILKAAERAELRKRGNSIPILRKSMKKKT